LEESLLVVTLGVVDVSESKVMSFFLLFFKEDKAIASEETFLEIEKAKTLLEEHLAMQ